jgi:hypothetical protein
MSVGNLFEEVHTVILFSKIGYSSEYRPCQVEYKFIEGEGTMFQRHRHISDIFTKTVFILPSC